MRPVNPFSSHAVRPGARDYRFSSDEASAAGLVQRFLTLPRHQAVVVGPHGSGKSTLLLQLVPLLREPFSDVVVAQLHPDDRRVPPADPSALRVIDGFEQLGPLRRGLLIASGRPLLATSHRRHLRLPTLYQTKPSIDIARGIVAELVAAHPRYAPALLAHFESSWQQQQGNLRDVLFDLYDQFERLRTENPRR